MNRYAIYSKLTGELILLMDSEPTFRIPGAVGLIYIEEGIDLRTAFWDQLARKFRPQQEAESK